MKEKEIIEKFREEFAINSAYLNDFRKTMKQDMGMTFKIKELEDFILQALSTQRQELGKEYELAKQAPMGVSQWRNHGEKYGYDKFFEGKWKKELAGLIKKKRMKWKESDKIQIADGYNQAITEILKIIEEV